MSFVHLHVHTEYSLLDGMARIKPLLARAKELGMEALALTDHGVMYGAIDFYLAAKEMGIKPIIGCEMYIAPGSRLDRDPKADARYYHLTVLAKDLTGYRNLLKLSAKAHLEGFYYKPRIDYDLLAQFSEGLIVLAGCPSGEVPRRIADGDLEGARVRADWFKEVFGPDFYFELQDHDLQELRAINAGLSDLSKKQVVPVVATNDSHFIYSSEIPLHKILLAIRTNSTPEGPKGMHLAGEGYHLRSPAEMATLFADVPEALSNTLAIAEKCNLELELGRLHLPEFPVAQGYTPESYLAELAWQGLQRRYITVTPEIEDRLRYELDVIAKTGFASYILIVWDFVRYARESGILFGPRGSAAGSIVCYALGISDIEPLSNNLVFERFLNLERREMPDIDMDFADDRRGEMIEYATSKYGEEHVAQIITFGTLGAKAAIRDVGRAMGRSYGEMDRLTKLFPAGTPWGITLDRAIAESQPLRELYHNDEPTKVLIDTARSLEGIARHVSTHAAGVVISHDPLVEYVPLQRGVRGNEIVTQYHMDAVARIGLLKMDFLGLTNLTILGRAVELVKKTTGISIDLQNLPLDDSKAFEMLSTGETTGIFQLESAGMRQYVKELKPTSVADIAALISLYRPGPMAHIPRFLRAKAGLEPIEYPHPTLEPILKDTYGVIVYQEQVLQIVRAVAGYSLGQADVLRKAMGKKDPVLLKKERNNFVKGAVKNGYREEVASKIFDLIEPFAGYAFNRAHACCYALVAYQTAYMKANYPVEFMTALLGTHIGEMEKTASAVGECRRLGIPVFPPDIDHSATSFVIEALGDSIAIRFGLGAIKNVGAAADKIVEARQRGGAFRSLEDFCRRVNLQQVSKRALESMIKAGAFDSLGTRSQLLAAMDQMVAFSQQAQRAASTGQFSLFDGLEERIDLLALPPRADEDPKEKLRWEKELLGLYLSSHPTQEIGAELYAKVTIFTDQASEELVGQKAIMAGVVSDLRVLMTKNGVPMLVGQLDDGRGSIDLVVYPKLYERTRDIWQENAVVIVHGKIDSRGDRLQLTCDSASAYKPGSSGNGMTDRPPDPPSDKAENPTSPSTGRTSPHWRLSLTISASGDETHDMECLQQLYTLLDSNRGWDIIIYLVVAPNGHEQVEVEFPELRVGYSDDFIDKLTVLLGADAIVLEELNR